MILLWHLCEIPILQPLFFRCAQPLNTLSSSVSSSSYSSHYLLLSVLLSPPLGCFLLGKGLCSCGGQEGLVYETQML